MSVRTNVRYFSTCASAWKFNENVGLQTKYPTTFRSKRKWKVQMEFDEFEFECSNSMWIWMQISGQRLTWSVLWKLQPINTTHKYNTNSALLQPPSDKRSFNTCYSPSKTHVTFYHSHGGWFGDLSQYVSHLLQQLYD